MQTKTYSQRTDKQGKRPDISVEPAVDGSGQVIFTVGPHGGPYQSVYLDSTQATMVAASLHQVTEEAVRLECTSDDPENHQGDTCPVHEEVDTGWFPRLSDERLFDAVAGAGADMFSWYRWFDADFGNQVLNVRMENGENEIIPAILAPADFRRAIRTLASNHYPGVAHLRWNDPDVDSDIDANDADVILQQAVLGEVIYG